LIGSLSFANCCDLTSDRLLVGRDYLALAPVNISS